MKREILLMLFCSFFLIQTAQAQKVKLKDGIVYLDGEEFMAYESRDFGREFYVYELDDKENEVILVQLKDAAVNSRSYEAFVKIYFIRENKSLDITKRGTRKSFIKWFIENKVLTKDGRLNPEKIDLFIVKYDDDLTSG